MGWSQTLPHKGITTKQVERVLNKIKAGGFLGSGRWFRREANGWHSECDISLDQKRVHFSGSWSISGETDLPQRFIKAAHDMKLPVGKRLSNRG